MKDSKKKLFGLLYGMGETRINGQFGRLSSTIPNYQALPKQVKGKIIESRWLEYHGIFRSHVKLYRCGKNWMYTREWATVYRGRFWVYIMAFLIGGKVVNQ